MLKKKDIQEMYTLFNHFSMFGGKKYSFSRGTLIVITPMQAFMVAQALNLILRSDKYTTPEQIKKEMEKDINRSKKKN